MILDIKRINLTEKDIEDWLFENPSEVNISWGKVEGWIARQFKVPSGIIDLLGMDKDGNLYVVEVKNAPVGSGALAQVCRYKADIQAIIGQLEAKNGPLKYHIIHAVVIGTGIESVSMFEANALDVSVLTFSVSLEVEMSGRVEWRDEFVDRLNEQYQELADNPAFSFLAKTARDNMAEWDEYAEMTAHLVKDFDETEVELSQNGTGE